MPLEASPARLEALGKVSGVPQALVVAVPWNQSDTERPHRSLKYRTPAEFAEWILNLRAVRSRLRAIRPRTRDKSRQACPAGRESLMLGGQARGAGMASLLVEEGQGGELERLIAKGWPSSNQAFSLRRPLDPALG